MGSNMDAMGSAAAVRAKRMSRFKMALEKGEKKVRTSMITTLSLVNFNGKVYGIFR